jgi:hypothetical protein
MRIPRQAVMMAEAMEACEETLEGKGKAKGKGKCRDQSPSNKRGVTSALQDHHQLMQISLYNRQEGFAKILPYKIISSNIANTSRLLFKPPGRS